MDWQLAVCLFVLLPDFEFLLITVFLGPSEVAPMTSAAVCDMNDL